MINTEIINALSPTSSKNMKIIKLGDFPEESQIAPANASLDYIQEEDCCDRTDSPQILTIETQNGGVDSKDIFYVLKTERWAFDKPADIVAVLEDFITRFN